MIVRVRHEAAVLAIAVLVGALLRLSGLSAHGLGADESVQAWRAAVAANEGAVVAQGVTSAFLVSLQAVLFSLAGATTFLARLPAALCGIALLLAPLTVKDALGPLRTAALVALLALDPTLIQVARDASGASASLLAAALAVAGLVRWAHEGRSDAARARAGAVLASASLGLLLTTGADAWTLLPLIGLAAAALRPWRHGAARARDCAWAFGATFVLAATAGLWAPAWASGTSASLTVWLERWTHPAGLEGPLRSLAGAPLTLLLALAAVGYGAKAAPRRAGVLVAGIAWTAAVALCSPGPPAALALLLVVAASEGVRLLAERGQRLALVVAALAGLVQTTLAARPLMQDATVPTRPGLEVLASDLEGIAVLRRRDVTELPVLVLGERDDPAVRWALRRGRKVRDAPYRPAEVDGAGPALVAPSNTSAATPPGYVGATYETSRGTVDLWVPLD